MARYELPTPPTPPEPAAQKIIDSIASYAAAPAPTPEAAAEKINGLRWMWATAEQRWEEAMSDFQASGVLSYREIAKRTGLNPSTVQVRINRARRRSAERQQGGAR